MCGVVDLHVVSPYLEVEFSVSLVIREPRVHLGSGLLRFQSGVHIVGKSFQTLNAKP